MGFSESDNPDIYQEFKKRISSALDENPEYKLRDPLLSDATISGWFKLGESELFSGFPVHEDDKVLDVGCGDGEYSSFCARLGASVTLVDVDEDYLERAFRRVCEVSTKPTHRVLQSPESPLNLASETYSRILCLEVLEHTDSPTTLLRDIVRLGQPGALYLLSVPAPESEQLQKELAPPALFEKPNHIHVFGREEFRQLVERCGLEILNHEYTGFFWSLWSLLLWLEDSERDQSPSSLLTGQWLAIWAKVLRSERGRQLKRGLDQLIPKSQVIVARKGP